MDYKNKLSAVCEPKTNLFGEEFNYDIEDDIVVFFPKKDSDIAFCYTRADLKKIALKNFYDRENKPFSALVLPYTNHYIINSRLSTESDRHSFILEKENMNLFRPNTPQIYKIIPAEGKRFEIFENPPILDKTDKTEEIKIEPSQAYLEMEEKFSRLRRLREEGKRDDGKINIEQAPFRYITESGREYGLFTNEYKPVFRDLQNIIATELRRLLSIIDEVKFTGDFMAERISDPIRLISTISRLQRNPPDIPEYTLAITENENDIKEDIVWYKNGKIHRRDDLPAIITTYMNGKIEFTWYKDGVIHRDNGLPAKISSDLSATWYIDGEIKNAEPNMPAIVTPDSISYFNDGILSSNNPELPAKVIFGNFVFTEIDVQGILVYINNENIIRESLIPN
jgi:hypothetical protein